VICDGSSWVSMYTVVVVVVVVVMGAFECDTREGVAGMLAPPVVEDECCVDATGAEGGGGGGKGSDEVKSLVLGGVIVLCVW